MASTLLNKLAAKPVPQTKIDIAVRIEKPKDTVIKRLEDIKPKSDSEDREDPSEEKKDASSFEELVVEQPKGIIVKDLRETSEIDRDRIIEKIRGKQPYVP